jgi:hypothetical protein
MIPVRPSAERAWSSRPNRDLAWATSRASREKPMAASMTSTFVGARWPVKGFTGESEASTRLVDAAGRLLAAQSDSARRYSASSSIEI